MNLVFAQEPAGWVYLPLSEMLPLAALSLSPYSRGEAFQGLGVREAEHRVSVHPLGWMEEGAISKCWPVARLASSSTLSGDGFDGRVFYHFPEDKSICSTISGMGRPPVQQRLCCLSPGNCSPKPRAFLLRDVTPCICTPCCSGTIFPLLHFGRFFVFMLEEA